MPSSGNYAPIPKTIWIAFGHKARQGKDTCAEAIQDLYPGVTVKAGFADALKTYCRVVYGMTIKDAPLLQRVGSEFRERDPQVWVDTLYWTMKDLREARRIADPILIVVPDLRYPNEVDFIRDMGGWVIRVRRLNADGTPFVAADRPFDHPSETALDHFTGWDTTLINQDPVRLREDVRRLVTQIYVKAILR